MIVCGRTISDELIERLQREGSGVSRRQLARQLCEWMDWKGPAGRSQEMSARKAIAKLQHVGRLSLPPARTFPRAGRVDRKSSSMVSALAVSLEELGAVTLLLVPRGPSALGRVWRQLLDQEHPLRAGPLCGAQLRYLINSPQGYLGGLAFSAAAWRLAARDQWIGWCEAARVENLHLVVNNSRFLIRPHVQVPNLASHVLAQALERLPEDWQQRYGYRPVLVETFVEHLRFKGVSYAAANWQAIGLTQGRGRQDRSHKRLVSPKVIWVRALDRNFRALLRTKPTQPRLASAPRATPAVPRSDLPIDWAQNEWATVELGDRRLHSRLLTLARDFYARPIASLTETCRGDWAKYRAACRFFAHPRTGMNALLSSHYQATMRRVSQHKVVLAIQDTTSLNYTAHSATEMIGPIGPQADGAQGLLVHDTLACTPDGIPLGLLDVQCWARDPEETGKKHKRDQLPIEQKESAKWLHSAQAVAALSCAAPQTSLVSVGDREADVYELFAWARNEPTAPKLLVRAMQDRAVGGEQGQLWAQVQAQEAEVGYEVRVPRRGSKPARTARLSVRYAAVELQPPKRKPLGTVHVWAILVQELDPPPMIEPIEWMLLTTVPVPDAASALERVQWYVQRWNIEVYHRTLKSGCRIEDRQLGGADSIESCLAIDMVVAWRVMHLTKLGRQTPDVPCTVYFEEAQWKALTVFVNRRPELPTHPPSLGVAQNIVATLGGWLGRKSDGPPGTEVIWRGLQRMDDITAMWCAMTGSPFAAPFAPPVSSHYDYG